MTTKRLMQLYTAFLLCAPSNALRAALCVCGIGRIVPIHRNSVQALVYLKR
ncbi:MAG: hypothetical protein OXI20_16230 [Rhodospirillales bacterium]|nr:hypothetical protein [Rhodospirillales bacterium]